MARDRDKALRNCDYCYKPKLLYMLQFICHSCARERGWK